MVCSQNARRLSAGLNLKEIEGAMEKKVKKRNQFTLWKTTSEKAVLKKRHKIESRIVDRVVRLLSIYTSARIFVRNFRLFQSISDRLPKRGKEKRKDRRERKCPAPTASAIGPCHTIIQISRTFRL